MQEQTARADNQLYNAGIEKPLPDRLPARTRRPVTRLPRLPAGKPSKIRKLKIQTNENRRTGLPTGKSGFPTGKSGLPVGFSENRSDWKTSKKALEKVEKFGMTFDNIVDTYTIDISNKTTKKCNVQHASAYVMVQVQHLISSYNKQADDQTTSPASEIRTHWCTQVKCAMWCSMVDMSWIPRVDNNAAL